jgi:hypothetical protein
MRQARRDQPYLLADVCRVLKLDEDAVNLLVWHRQLHPQFTPSGRLRIFSKRETHALAKMRAARRARAEQEIRS